MSALADAREREHQLLAIRITILVGYILYPLWGILFPAWSDGGDGLKTVPGFSAVLVVLLLTTFSRFGRRFARPISLGMLYLVTGLYLEILYLHLGNIGFRLGIWITYGTLASCLPTRRSFLVFNAVFLTGTLSVLWLRKDPLIPFVLCGFGFVGLVLWIGLELRLSAARHLEEVRARLVQASGLAALGEMAAGIAHEINNPLAIIAGRARQLPRLLESGDMEKARQWLDNIEKTTFRIASIIKGMRNLSRDAERDPMTSVSIGDVLNDTLSLCEEKLKYRGISLTVDGRDTPLFVSGRPTQLAQVLLNLLNNAVDALEQTADRWIRIELCARKRWVEIRVSDGGPGIPAETIKKIFHPFFTTKAYPEGTGLGLTISKRIVHDHGGELAVDTASPSTTFVIRLPADRSRAQKAA